MREIPIRVLAKSNSCLAYSFKFKAGEPISRPGGEIVVLKEFCGRGRRGERGEMSLELDMNL
jgi:hypothetical protein